MSEKRRKWQTKLSRLGACQEAVEWTKGHKSFPAAWKACKRADWMFWLAARLKIKRETLVLALVNAIRPVCLKHSKDKRVAECLDVCERWAHGKATMDEVRAAYAYASSAASAASAAAAAASSAAASAAAVAYAAAASSAASAVADAAAAYAYAASAAASAVADAASAYADAAYADAAAYAYARTAALKAMADSARKDLTKPVMAAWRRRARARVA